MKRLLWIVGGVCAAIVLLVLLVPVVVDLKPLQARWLPLAEQALGRRLSVGHIQLSILPFGVTVREVTIMDDPAFGGEPFFSADAVTIHPAFWPLLHRQVDIAALTVRHPAVTLIRRADGRWNVETLGVSAAPDRPARAGRALPSTGVPPIPPALDHFNLSNGRITVRDQRGGASPIVADRINLSADNVRMDGTATFNGSAHVNGWTSPVVLSGRFRVAPNAPAIEEADLRVGLGTTDLHAVVQRDRGGTGAAGTVPGSGWSILVDSKRIDLDGLKDGVERTGPPAAVGAMVPAGRPAAGSAPASGTPPWTEPVTIEATIGELRLHQQTITAIRATGRMQDGAVRLETLTANVAGGAVEAKGRVDLTQPDRPFTGDVVIRSVDLESLQRVWPGVEPRMTGTATVTASMTGSLGRRWNWQEAVKTVEGAGRVDVRDGAILGIDLTGTVTDQMRKLIGRKGSNAAAPARTPFSAATAEATLHEGSASIDSVRVESDDFLLSASGQVGLTPPRPVALKAEMRLSKPISRQFNKTAVSLLSDQGRLAIPVLIRGTVAEPVVRPDATLLAKRTKGRLNERVFDEVMTDQLDQLRQTGKSLIKGLLGR